MVTDVIQDQVVFCGAPSEILSCVVNNLVCADCSYHIHAARTAYAGDMCAKELRDLHCKRPHATSRTVDQYSLSSLTLSPVAEPLQCRECRDRNRSCFFKRHTRRLQRQFRLGGTGILGE